MKIPHVIGIGAQKAGTSWLHNNIKQNRSFWVPPFKEVHFFDHNFVPENRAWTEGHVRKGVKSAAERWEKQGIHNHKRKAWARTALEKPMFTKNWYEHIFSLCPDGRIPIDITPEYSSISTDGIKFAEDVLGSNFRAIYIVRSPVHRAISQIKMMIRRRKLTSPSREDWMDLLNLDVIYERGNYKSHISRWMSARPKESLLFIPFGMISKDPLQVMRDIEEFTNAESHDYRNLNEKIFASAPISIPDYVYENLNISLCDQEAYLIDTFGSEFFENSK
ncbi:sulfotransferase domain-containing protein [Paracoccus marcusii]|uniref:sulfotransferase domain-containing protein n=1 Tax=Paracoccus marcusii TaxID=59779 RepID=UPI0024936A63|nr:sulfotransferase domain-containing protein [Paracoccus marcusii]